MTRSEFLKSVIRVREHIMRTNKSKKDNLLCAKKLSKLKRQMEAYGRKWDSEGWRKFLERNYNDIVFLIPGNNSRESKIKTLNALI